MNDATCGWNDATSRHITKEEWRAYKWIRVGEARFLRGIKITQPPDDGYEYVEVTTFSDTEQKWARVVCVEPQGAGT